MTDCIFCKIAAGEIPAEKVYEDDHVVGFRDLSPQAPVHVLIIPRRHIATLNDLTEADEALVGHMHRIAARVAADEGLAERGYRTLINCNAEGGQTVFHLHLHLLGGRQMTWPPG
ncbi:MAG: histidine triad nucleotide-binding protein [Gammaproteobacteria bacterium]|nr:MAG: histidine triad nucleotide-binding protein [Gammaproteobacteria bacterium]